jgi:hypothetical protein
MVPIAIPTEIFGIVIVQVVPNIQTGLTMEIPIQMFLIKILDIQIEATAIAIQIAHTATFPIPIGQIIGI